MKINYEVVVTASENFSAVIINIAILAIVRIKQIKIQL